MIKSSHRDEKSTLKVRPDVTPFPTAFSANLVFLGNASYYGKEIVFLRKFISKHQVKDKR